MTKMTRLLIAAGLFMVMNSFSTGPEPKLQDRYLARTFTFFPAMSADDSSYKEVKTAVETELKRYFGKLSFTFYEDGIYEGTSPDGDETGRWRLSEDGKTLTMTTSEEKSKYEIIKVIEISENHAELEFKSDEGRFRVFFIK